VSDTFNYTGYINPGLSFWYRATPAADIERMVVMASLTGGSPWTIVVVPAFTVTPDSVYHQVSVSNLTALNGQSNVRFRWLCENDTSGNINIDDVVFTATASATAPTVVTNAATNIGTTTATLNGNVTSDGGSAITERGFYCDTNSNPTTKYTVPGTTGAYTKDMTDLLPGTKYYFKAFATNSVGTSYGSILDFTTQALYCGVNVTIENTMLEGYPSQVLAYTIDVHNAGNVVDNVYLSVIPDGWPDISIVPPVLIDVMPSEHRQATVFVHVPEGALPCTYKPITVVAESQFCGATDNDTAQAHVTEIPRCGVDVTIVQDLLEGWPSQVLAYTIDVHNAGNIVDNINLSYIPDGWPDITIVPQVLTDVLPSENRQATISVHVPDGALPDTYKGIIVVAESQFCGATDNNTAQAHVIRPVRGPIFIVGNENFIPEKGVNGGGSGTDTDPYIIENWGISASSAHGIDIENTTAYFVVRNTLIENGGTTKYGIYLRNAPNASIDNNTCRKDNSGIFLYTSSNDNVTNNTCETTTSAFPYSTRTTIT